MLYIYTIQPTRIEMLSVGATPEEEQVVSEHFTYLKELTDQGVVLLAGRTLNNDPNTFGIVVFRANSEEDAKRLVENDPAVKHRVMQAEIYPFKIALLGELPLKEE